MWFQVGRPRRGHLGGYLGEGRKRDVEMSGNSFPGRANSRHRCPAAPPCLVRFRHHEEAAVTSRRSAGSESRGEVGGGSRCRCLNRGTLYDFLLHDKFSLATVVKADLTRVGHGASRSDRGHCSTANDR